MENIIVIVILVIVTILGSFALRKSKQNKLVSSIQKGDIETFEKTVNSFLTKMLFPAINLEYLKMNAYILAGEEEKINQTFDILLGMRKNKKNTEDVTMKAFNYYVGVEDKERTTRLLETINTFNNVRMRQEANIMYDIFILKNDKHLEEMEKELETLPDAQKAINEYLISVQYANKGEKKKAKEYESLSKMHMKEPLPNSKQK